MNPIPDLFRDPVTLTPRHRAALSFSNAHKMREWIRTNPTRLALRRAIVIEVERGPAIRRTEVLNPLLAALQRAERKDIERAIGKHLKKFK